ncbi:MAG: SpoIIE family protein phosphatase [Acidobacteriota bacterium]
MKLRDQLLLVFVLLAVLPLGIIVLVSYVSSLETFHRGVEEETQELADRVSLRMEEARGRARRQVGALGGQPQRVARLLDLALAQGNSSRAEVASLLEQELGEVGTWVEGLSVEFRADPSRPADPENGAMERLQGFDGEDLMLLEETERPRWIELRPDSHELAGAPAEPPAENLLFDAPSFPIETQGQVVGRVRAALSGEPILREVLRSVDRTRGEIPFARGGESGELTTLEDEDRRILQELGVDQGRVVLSRDWVVAQRYDAVTDLTFGVARPVGENLRALRRNALRNLLFGLVLAGLAFAAVLPVSSRMDRNLTALIRGAERVAGGDLEARVPVQGENEIGQLSRAFNRMAFELQCQQEELLDQQRLSREAEVERRLLEVENLRRGQELEEARRFQLALLPRELPAVEGWEMAVFTSTATEVGGDYYDYRIASGTEGREILSVVIGDATGHGARAGLLVAVIKSLISTLEGESSLSAFVHRAADTIRGMGLRRMAMALAIVRLDGAQLRIVGAGMPPPLIYRAESGEVDEVPAIGLPLGTGLSRVAQYRECSAQVAPGDVLLLSSDGFPELLNPEGEVLSYERLRQQLVECAAGGASAEVIRQRLSTLMEDWAQERPLEDDTTFVVLRREA